MSKSSNDFIIRFSLLRTIGIFLLVFGIFCICFFGAKSVNMQNQIAETETNEEYIQQNYNKIAEKKSEKFFMVVIGGFLVISAVPFFYMPYEQHCITLKFRRRKPEAEEDLQDSEFDYPDEDFDYILDEKVRKILIELRDENIRKKKNKK